ncbi:MAG: carboxypeptidase regulatory-like domain-containing protein [Fuerstiella sp.]|nr:carboxypeptidase regulatory-like domain-containing protein [Fuerstiella sp.]MCP4855710.1 carboxypeptidase regulatory-like domain-containing protein [Fuerstiella sp.]
MKHAQFLALIAAPFLTGSLSAETIRGKVVSKSGKPVEGVMVSAFDEDHQKSTSVFSQMKVVSFIEPPQADVIAPTVDVSCVDTDVLPLFFMSNN